MFFNKPNKIIFELTNRCNLRCRMCDIWKEKPKKDFSLELFESILKDKSLNSIKNISFTGGEPFIMDNLSDYYLAAREFVPKSFINISTNGYLTEKIMRFLEFADINKTSITISYDGIKSHDSIRGKIGSSKRLLETAAMIKKRYPQLRLSLKYTITPENYGELLSTAKQAKRLEIPFNIKVIEKLSCHHTRVPSVDKPEFSRKVFDSIAEQAKEIINLKIEINKKYINDLIKKNSKKCMTCNWSTKTLFIGLDNRVFICRKKESVGNINKQTIRGILRSGEMKHIKKQMKNCKDLECISYLHI